MSKTSTENDELKVQAFRKLYTETQTVEFDAEAILFEEPTLDIKRTAGR